MRWFSADSHFCHTNILRYCNRPFKDTLQMDITMMDNWNDRIQENDLVFHLGDFSFKPWIWGPTLNGKKILIQGNHDRKKDNGLFTYYKSLEIKLGPFQCLLIHRPKDIPINTFERIDFVLSGHVHNRYLCDGKIINLGVDVWDFKPVSEVELLKYLKEIK